MISILLILFMGSGIGYVWSNFEGTQIGFDLSRLQQEELDLATLTSPQSLEDSARALGLRDALPEQIIILP